MKLEKAHADHLKQFRIDDELLEAAGVCSVSDLAARELFGIHGRSHEDCGGILFPYFNPATGERTGGRIKLDTPIGKQKYLMEQGCTALYFSPGDPLDLEKANVHVIIVEAEKSALALTACFNRTSLRAVVIATGGAYAWKRTNGKEIRSDGHSEPTSGPSPSLDLLNWQDRKVLILTDSNVVGSCLEFPRHGLAEELRSRGADVFTVATPKIKGLNGKEVNGPDDFLGVTGDAALFDLLNSATPETKRPPRGNEDTSNGERFAEQHSDNARYWPERKKWLTWDGTHWSDDKLRDVRELAKETSRSIYAEAANIKDDDAREKLVKWATKSLQMNGVRDMLDSASSIPGMKVATEQVDADPWLLNFQNGTLDVRDGKLRGHMREDYITKIVRCDYVPDTIGPRWLKFVEEMFGSEEVASWVQKAVGYSLTGNTSEKVAFLLIGSTDTSKSTFLDTLRTIFEPYSQRIMVESLMRTNGRSNNIDADLADLRGARFAITSETEEDHRLGEAQLKQITQGIGTIRATRKYENPIEFPETHHLWIDANHNPRISGTDDAIWNRLAPIPCNHKLKPEEIDRKLKGKLLHEAEAVASWVVEGARRWYEKGLKPFPKAIEEMRGEWRTSSDVIGQFVEECCYVDKNEEDRAGLLYVAFKLWAEENGHYVFSGTAFGNRLSEGGFSKRRGDKPMRMGLSLLHEWRSKAEFGGKF
jgi:putative DNA primase/helicase